MKTKYWKRIIITTVLIATINFVVACFSVNNNDSLITITPSPVQVIANTSTQIITPIFTSIPTQTLLPMIESSDVEIIIQSLHLKCRLPCWGNIILGETSELAAKHLLSSFGELGAKSVTFQYHNAPVVIDLTFKDDLVDSINLPPQITETYHIRYLLLEYGKPEDIEISIISETADGTSWFNLVIVYPQQGFFAVFSAEGKITDSIINICLEGVSPDLYLVKPNNYSVKEMKGLVTIIYQQEFMPLDSLTLIDKTQFYEIFSEQNNQCVKTKSQEP